jgi:2-aminoadipate transaminase
MQTNQLEASLRLGPKFMYVLPNFQNPGGTTLAEGRRHELVLLAERYGIPIIEDDPYGQLRYEGAHLTPLIVLDRQNLHGDDGYSKGNVIYLSTFSTFTQMVAYEVARDNFLDEHIKLIRKVYGERRDVMLAALEEYFPPQVSWTRPQGGLFLWVTLPQGMDAHQLFQAALKENVAFVPGDSFYSGNGYTEEGRRHFRLNFSNAEPAQIREGIRRLSVAIKNQLARLHPETVRR